MNAIPSTNPFVIAHERVTAICLGDLEEEERTRVDMHQFYRVDARDLISLAKNRDEAAKLSLKHLISNILTGEWGFV
jgi:hypothetical protein